MYIRINKLDSQISDRSKVKIYLLVGGGTDSAALINFYQSRRANINGVHFNYGQPSLAGERRSINALTEYYKISISSVDFGITISHDKGEYYCRNAILLMAAASTFSVKQGILSLGIHSGTPYYDCSPEFLKDIQHLFDGYFGGTVQVEAPFLDFTKQDIYEYCRINKVPVEITFSCERQGDRPCGECPSCIDRRMLDAIK